MKSFKPIIVAALFLGTCQYIGGVHAEGSNTTKESKTPQNGSQSVLGGTEKKAKPPTEEDYIKPLDNWLKAKGSPLSGRDFYEVGRQYHLDPDFLIAVTKAETQLCTVKQRGSQYNCGSVGSYDSTATTFVATSYRHGIEQIAQTVTNGYLSRYTQLSQLSRSHNKAQSPVYATSDGNWFRNTRDTMNELKGKQEPDFLFRTP